MFSNILQNFLTLIIILDKSVEKVIGKRKFQSKRVHFNNDSESSADESDNSDRSEEGMTNHIFLSYNMQIKNDGIQGLFKK